MRATVTTTLCKLSAKELAARKQSTSRHNFFYSSNCVKKQNVKRAWHVLINALCQRELNLTPFSVF